MVQNGSNMGTPDERAGWGEAAESIFLKGLAWVDGDVRPV